MALTPGGPAVFDSNTAAQTSATINYSLSGGDAVVVAGLSIGDNDVDFQASATFNGVPMDRVIWENSFNGRYSALFVLPVGNLSGTFPCVISWVGAEEWAAGVFHFTGADQAVGYGAAGSGEAASNGVAFAAAIGSTSFGFSNVSSRITDSVTHIFPHLDTLIGYEIAGSGRIGCALAHGGPGVSPTFTYEWNYGTAGERGSACGVEILEGAAAPAPIATVDGPWSGDTGQAENISCSNTGGAEDTVLWTVESGPGGTFGNNAALSTTFTPSGDGVSVLRCTLTNATGSDFDEANFTASTPVGAPVATVDGPWAGTDGVAENISCSNSGGAADTVLWTVESGPGGTFGDNSVLSTTFTPSGVGTSVLRCTLTNATGSDFDEANFVASTAATAPDVGALTATPSNIRQGGVTNLDAPNLDWGGEVGTLLWTQQSGQSGNFSATNIANPTWTESDGTTGGTVTLRLTATNSQGSDFSDIVVGVYDSFAVQSVQPVMTVQGLVTMDKAPGISAPTISITVPTPMVAGTGYGLTCNVSDDGGDPAITFAWDDGGAGGSFDDNTAQNPTYTPVAGTGTITITCQATNSGGTDQDQSSPTIHWTASGVNVTVPANVEMYDSAACSVVVGDYGNPPAPILWSVASAIFGNVSPTDQLNTTYTPNTPGADSVLNTVQCTLTNAAGSVSDSGQIQHFSTAPSNVSVQVIDTSLEPMEWTTCTATYTLGSDPTPTFQWIQVAGPDGAAEFEDENAVPTQVRFSQEGTYQIRLVITDAWGNVGQDTSVPIGVVAVGPSNVVAVAASNGAPGIDFPCNVTYTPGSDPNPDVLWTQESGPGTITFDDATKDNPNAQADVVGTYTLRATVTGSYGGSDFDVTGNIVISEDLQCTIDVYDANIVEGVAGQIFASISGGVPPYNITWSSTKQGGGGTPPVFTPSANVEDPMVTYGIAAANIGAWDLRIDVEDSATTPDTAFSEVVQTVVHIVTDSITTNRTEYELALDGSVNASASVNGSDTTGTYTWSQVGGAGELTFTPNGSNSTVITSSGEGTFTAQVSYDNGRDIPVSVQFTVVVHEAGWTPGDMNDFVDGLVKPLVEKLVRRLTV